MSLTIEGVRSIITYYQSDIPTNISEGDIWFNSSNGNIAKYENGKWFSIKGTFVNGEFGYIMGGTPISTWLSFIQKIAFPFNSGTATNVGNLTASMWGGGVCNSSNYGYLLGGYMANLLSSTIQRITFPFNSGSSTNVGNLTKSKYLGASCNSSNYGYSLGGLINQSTIYTTNIDRITFPFDSGTSSIVGNLNYSKLLLGGCNSSNHGFTFGGINNSGITNLSEIERISFPFNSGTSSQVGNLSYSGSYAASCNSTTYGFNYANYAYNNINFSTISRITFPFNSGTASNVGNLTVSKWGSSGCNSTNYGFCIGGYQVSVSVSTIERFSFPFDSGSSSVVGYMSCNAMHVSTCDETDFITQFI